MILYYQKILSIPSVVMFNRYKIFKFLKNNYQNKELNHHYNNVEELFRINQEKFLTYFEQELI